MIENKLNFVQWFKQQSDKTYVAYIILAIIGQIIIFSAGNGPVNGLREIQKEDTLFDAIFVGVFMFIPSYIIIGCIILGYINPYRKYRKNDL